MFFRTVSAAQKFSEWSDSYDQSMKDYKWCGPDVMMKALADRVDWCRPDLKILDVGIGTGLLSARIRQDNKAAHIAGIDVAEGMIAQCQGKNIVDDLKLVDLEREALPYDDHEFDAVLSCGVFEFIENPQAVIKEMVRVVKPGGVIAFTTEPSSSFLSKISRLWSALLYLLSSFRRFERSKHYEREKEGIEQAIADTGISEMQCLEFTAYRPGRGSRIKYHLFTGVVSHTTT